MSFRLFFFSGASVSFWLHKSKSSIGLSLLVTQVRTIQIVTDEKSSFFSSYLFIVFSLNISYSQDCASGTSTVDLNANAVTARLNNTGSLWWDGEEGQYNVSGTTTAALNPFFFGDFWIGGFDPGGNLKIAAQTYDISYGDYYPGPLDMNGETNAIQCNNWDRFFIANYSEIEQHLQDYNVNDTIDFTPPASILRWPATGNPHFESVHGFDLPENMSLAPFVDRNRDGL